MLGPQEVALLGGVALLEEVCHFEGFDVSDAQARHSVAFTSAMDQNVELSVFSPAPYLPAHHCAFCHGHSGLNL